MTQEKDHKASGPVGPGRVAPKTLVGVPPIPSGRPPRSPDGLPGRSAPPLSAGPRPRDFRPSTSTARQGPNASHERRDEPAVEEISNSLLLPDDSSSGVMPGLEELSGSLLLEDPTEARDEPPAGDPRTQTVPRDAAAGRGTVLGLPDLPTSTPPPNLETLAMRGASARPDVGAQDPLRQPAALIEDPRSAPIAGPSDQEGVDEATHIVPPPPVDMYEALRGYEASGPAADAAPHAQAAEALGPTASRTAPLQGDVEVTSLPVSPLVKAAEGLKRALARLRGATESSGALPRTGRRWRRRWLLPSIAVAGLVVGVAAVAMIVSLARNGTAPAGETSEAKTASTISPPAPAAPSDSAAAAEATSQALAVPSATVATVVVSSTPCRVAGAARVVAASAIVAAGIEVRTLGRDVALGFAPSDHDASALRLDATSLTTLSKTDAQSPEAIRRVVPMLSGDGSLAMAIDADREGDSIQGRRTVPLDPPAQIPLEIGSAGGALVWARPGGPASGKIWPLEGDGSVEALRAAAEASPGPAVTAIAFRRSGSIWLGVASGQDALTPIGELSQVRGAGDAVGSPAVAANGGVVLAAWADRPAASDPWRLRWVSFKAGDAPGDPGTFTPPAGGKGEQAMSPGIGAVAGGRFLLVWTEGPAAGHDVRGLTLSQQGQPIGKPLVLSKKSVNAGQGQVAVNAAGRGVVAFLESADGGFQVMATPIQCAL